MEPVVCSECFSNEGLRLTAWQFGSPCEGVCPNCGKSGGHHLDREKALHLVQQFFVRGTFIRTEYGGAPHLQFNEHHAGFVEADTPSDLLADVTTLSTRLGIGIFYYGPNLWMIGENDQLHSLRRPSERTEVINRILSEYPSREFVAGEKTYRVRIGPKNPLAHNEYDSPPVPFRGAGRLDAEDFPVLYTSKDLEGCVHECRATMDDDVYVATLRAAKSLKLIDLTELISEDKTSFESLDWAVYMLFSAASHSYEVSRAIARAANQKGFDGLVYPSYFSSVRSGAMLVDSAYGLSTRLFKEMRSYHEASTASNIAFFGSPITGGLLRVDAINRIIMRRVVYDLSFGPVGY